MDFRQLENFIEVCEQMSFTKAANNMYLSQQGISKSIKALEDELGVPLFYRNASSLVITSYGTILLRYAKSLVSDYSKVLLEISREKNSAHSALRIGFTQGIGNFMPEKMLESYIKSHPEIQLFIREYTDTEVDNALVNGEIDIGFCTNPVDRKKLCVHHSKMMNVYFMLSENHRLAEQTSIDLRQLKEDTFISFGDNRKGHESFLERCRKAGFIPNIGIKAYDFSLMFGLCRKNMGVGIFVGEEAPVLEGLKILPDRLHAWEYSINICTCTERGVSFVEEEFINCFREW